MPPELIKVKHQLLTKNLAKRMLRLKTFAGDRIYRKARKEFLLEEMNQGNFTSTRFGILVFRGDDWRGNGRHTSEAFLDDRCNPPNDIIVTVERWKAETIKDFSIFFESFDQQTSVRAFVDCAKARAATHPRLTNISRNGLSRGIAGLHMFYTRHPNLSFCRLFGKTKTQKSHPTKFSQLCRLEMIAKEVDALLFFDRILASSPKFMNNQAIYWAMVTCYKAFPEEAELFWLSVRDGACLKPDSPELVLRNFLIDDTYRSYRRDPQSRKIHHNRMVWLWYAFLERRKVRKLRMPKKYEECILSGDPSVKAIIPKRAKNKM